MTSNLIIIAFAVTLLTVAASYDLNFFDYEKPIPHSEWKNITWANFRAKSNPFHSLNGSKEFAFISTEMTARRVDDLYEVTAVFHPSRSYVFSKRNIDRTLFRHEMYHFHITEYCTRMLRMEIASNLEAGESVELGSLLDRYESMQDSLQAAYDEQSYHSVVLGKQYEWEHRVDSLLRVTDLFQGTILGRHGEIDPKK